MQYDKKLHMIGGFLIEITGSLLHSVTFGLLVSIAAGLAKEIRDDMVYGGFDWLDFVATPGCGLVGCIVMEATK